MTSRQVTIASDHAGFDLKVQLVSWLKSEGWEVNDLGPFSDDRTDYPDHADQVCLYLRNHPECRGILICGSGQGMAIRANRYPHIRAALCWSPDVTKLSRLHNNANVLCLGSRFTDFETAKSLWEAFESTGFEGGRHEARVDKLARPVCDS